jgi:citrate lyase subunit beta / citryl-CoA lyase
MEAGKFDLKTFVRRTKLYVPANREKFVAKAWTRGADCIILDLEDAVAPADKASARRMVKDDIPIVRKGGAEVQVRINREFEEEDLDAIVVPGLTSIMIPKCESIEEVRRVDRLVTQLEKERGLPSGKIQFDLIFETARGIIRMEEIAEASPRIVSMTTGQADLSVDLGFTRYKELNFDQYFYAENKLLYAAHAAGVQPHGLGAQNNVVCLQHRVHGNQRDSSGLGRSGQRGIFPSHGGGEPGPQGQGSPGRGIRPGGRLRCGG